MRGQIHYLELVYPPISNQEAEWVKDNPIVKDVIAKSNLYFIGQKPETFFVFDPGVLQNIPNEYRIHFTYKSGDATDSGFIDISTLLQFREVPPDTEIDIELGPKLIRIWAVENGENKEVIDWFTTDKFLFDKSREKPFIIGFENYNIFMIYNLHYVGISKRENSLERLVIKPHDKRIRILSNEHPLNNGSRVTDEIVLFFFRVKSLEVIQYFKEEDLEQFGTNELGDFLKIVADAEKAFVKIMNTNYNEVKFKDYPFSTDGLYNTSIDTHTFSIDEDLKFITDTAIIKGVRRKPPKFPEGDFIGVTKEKVELIKAGE